MKKFIFILSLFVFASCGGKNWYEGGTLHKATVEQWKVATDENKLATSADFVANYKKIKGERYERMEHMKKDASSVMNCIDEAVKSNSIQSNQQVGELASACLIVSDN